MMIDEGIGFAICHIRCLTSFPHNYISICHTGKQRQRTKDSTTITAKTILLPLIFIIFNPNIPYNLILLVVVGKAHLNACTTRMLHFLYSLLSLEW